MKSPVWSRCWTIQFRRTKSFAETFVIDIELVSLFVAWSTDLTILQVKFINNTCHPDDRREEGTPSSCISVNKMPCHHIAVKLIKRFAGVLQTVGKWYLLKNYLTVRRSLSRCAPSGWQVQVILFYFISFGNTSSKIG